MGRLAGKVALITGGARGMGAAEARSFVREGARVLITDVLEEEGAALAAELGPAARFQRLDVSKEEEWERAVAAAQALGPLNVLVNNAAIIHAAAITQTTLADYQRVIGVNQVGTFLGIRAVIEPMKRAGGGSIVNISSIDGLQSKNGLIAYSEAIGMDRIARYEERLLADATDRVSRLPGVQIDGRAAHKAGVVSFNVEGVHPHDLGTVLDHQGVAIRTGHHCAMPVMEFFGIAGTARASIAFYNTRRDVDQLVAGIEVATRMLRS